MQSRAKTDCSNLHTPLPVFCYHLSAVVMSATSLIRYFDRSAAACPKFEPIMLSYILAKMVLNDTNHCIHALTVNKVPGEVYMYFHLYVLVF